MLEKLRFYLSHSFNDMRVNRQRTFFAILCIAAGVAAIVSLQTLAVMAADTLVGGAREANRADIRILPERVTVRREGDVTIMSSNFDKEKWGSYVVEKEESFMGITNHKMLFSPDGMAKISAWADENYPGLVEAKSYRQYIASIVGFSVNFPEKGTDGSFVSQIVIEASQYPLVGKALTTDGKPLRDVMKTPTDVVVSKGLAEKLGASVGSVLRLQGSESDFTVSAIVPDELEGGLENLTAGLFGFVIIDTSATPLFKDAVPGADLIYWRLSDPTRAAELNDALLKHFDSFGTRTADEVAEQNAQVAVALNQLVTIMGLISLLIGGIGIVNTMQVVVRRRTVEVAVLKTIGLQANEVTVLFLIEAFLMGVIGSVVGIVLGWGMALALKGVAETFFAQTLNFRIAPGPAISGLVVGTLVTTVFGFLPTLSAGQVRPGVVLRPNDSVIPRAGMLRSLGALLVVILALTVIAQPIVGDFGTAFKVMFGTFIAAGFMYILLWALIWIVGKIFPSFGLPDLKIALRSMLAARRRGASTLLALVIGVFSLSLITLFATAITNLFGVLLNQQAGGNVYVFAGGAGVLQKVETTLKDLEGVNSYNISVVYNASPLTLIKADGREIAFADMGETENTPDGPVTTNSIISRLSMLSAKRVDLKLPERKFLSGRNLTPADAGKPVAVIPIMPSDEAFAKAGLEVGDKIVYKFTQGSPFSRPDPNAPGPEITLEIVGLFQRPAMSMGADDMAVMVPSDVFPATVSPTQVSAIVDIQEDQLGALRRAMSKVPGTFVLETKFLNSILNTIIGQFTSFPILVAMLGLLVGGVVIANSVALTTMERRREIAIMKAVGLQRERVLGMLLLENALLGLIGGLIGVGIGLVALIIMQSGLSAQSGVTLDFVPYGSAFLLMGLCIVVALVAALLTAWGASGEKPLNVLRYE